ncbi:MAG: hypothetical protein R3B96_10500 [Pirellulaceae bacterium]
MIRCRISSTYFVRHHLPRRQLCSTLMPVIVSPQRHIDTTPQVYWPPELVQWWVR